MNKFIRGSYVSSKDKSSGMNKYLARTLMLQFFRDDTILDDELDENEFTFDNENEDALLAETEYDFVEATEVRTEACFLRLRRPYSYKHSLRPFSILLVELI